MALWTPANITNLSAWYDADDATTITESLGAVSQWRDKSAGLNHLDQASGALQPTTGTKQINSKNVLDWGGTASMANASISSTQPFWVWMVYQPDVLSGNQGLWEDQAVGRSYLNLSGSIYQLRTPTQMNFDCYDRLTVGEVMLCGVLASNTTSSIEQGGRTCYPPSTLATGTDGLGGITMGSNAFGSLNLDGQIAEVVIVSGAMSEIEKLSVEGYLQHKWACTNALPAWHQYYSTPPQVDVIADADAVLDSVDGNWTIATDTLYSSGNQYGIGGTSKTGTFSCTAPAQPTLTVTNNDDGTATATIAGATALTTNTVYMFSDSMTVTPSAVATISANGSKSFTVSPIGIYWFYALSDLSGLTAISTTIERVDVSDGSDTAESSEDQYIRQYGELFTVQNEVAATDTNYARTSTWTDSHTAYGWMQPIGSNLALQYEQRELTVTNKVWFAEDPLATEGDRIQAADGTTFVIRGVVDQAGLNRLWRIDVEEQK